jgi:hypothetical protein
VILGAAFTKDISPKKLVSQETLQEWNQKVEDWKTKGKVIWDDMFHQGSEWWNGNEDTLEDSSSVPIIPDDGKSSIPISLLPIPRPVDTSSSRKYISYLPHSGFHNQRVELMNALFLASYLNRTLLVPPIWINGAPAAGSYDKLVEGWESFSKLYTKEAVTSEKGWKHIWEENWVGPKSVPKTPVMMSWDKVDGTTEGVNKIEILNRWYGKRGSDQLVHGMTEEGVRYEVMGGNKMLPEDEVVSLIPRSSMPRHN